MHPSRNVRVKTTRAQTCPLSLSAFPSAQPVLELGARECPRFRREPEGRDDLRRVRGRRERVRQYGVADGVRIVRARDRRKRVPVSPESKKTADQQGAAFAASLNRTNPATAAACLRRKPVSAILKTAASESWGPVVSAPVLPRSPVTAFAQGKYAHVPLLQGSNHDEGRFFVGLEFDLAGHPVTRKQYPQLIKSQFGANAPAILARYPLREFPSPDLAYSAVLTDSMFSCPALGADELAAGSGVYASRRSSARSCPGSRMSPQMTWTATSLRRHPTSKPLPGWPPAAI